VAEASAGGTVTLLFTDIEGSTRLARELGDRWADVLARHHQIVGDAVYGNGGSVELTEGDAFFAIFPTASQGVRAAVDAQRGLQAEPWREEPVRVRMGLHTGEVRRAATGLVGLEVHRAARVAAGAHGGQVLLSQATHDELDGDHRAEDLGLHRLKDFPEPERLFHLVVDGRTADCFPAPKTLPVRPTNVPVLETPLVGRVQELRELHERLADGTRLLTLTGLGGAGKTRLAIAAAEALLEAFPGGAWFVALADVTEAERMLAAIADALRLPDDPAQSVLDVLAGRLQAERTLLVLDNLEQLRDVAAAVLDELLTAAGSVKVLATSQAPLRVAREYVMPLRPLLVEESRQLFVEVAERRRGGLDPIASAETIDQICRRLEGLPLAIELAAARTAALSPAELLDRLSRSFELLRVRDRDRPERHRSLRAAIGWSFELLSPEHQRLCADLALFVTPFSVSDAERLCQADVLDGLEELLELAFLRRVDTGSGETRFTMAQALREFAQEQLTAGGRLQEARRRHARWVLSLVKDAVAEAARGILFASERIPRRLDDVYAALAWAREHEPDLHLELVATVPDALVWFPQGSVLEQELAAAIERDPPPGPHLAGALLALGGVTYLGGDSSGAIELYRRASAMWDELGQPEGKVDALISLVYPSLNVDPASARRYAEEALALARELDDQPRIDRSAAGLGQVYVALGEVELAEPLIGEALRSTRDPGAAFGLRHLWADCALIAGDGREAVARYAAAVRAVPALEQSYAVAVELQGLAMGLACAGAHQDALEVDRIASALADQFNVHHRTPFWERLREQHIGGARAAAPDYVPSHPLDDLGAAREWALSLASRY
jgi:predicted ATPase/class 3 adenylate cyclase